MTLMRPCGRWCSVSGPSGSVWSLALASARWSVRSKLGCRSRRIRFRTVCSRWIVPRANSARRPSIWCCPNTGRLDLGQRFCTSLCVKSAAAPSSSSPTIRGTTRKMATPTWRSMTRSLVPSILSSSGIWIPATSFWFAPLP